LQPWRVNENPQIKSWLEEAKTFEIRMISRDACAGRGISQRIDATRLEPDHLAKERASDSAASRRDGVDRF
jgi:hypothetical protein